MQQNNSICIKAVVSGKVQGVFFRDSTQKKAWELQLTGWVKNLSNGNVELIACGHPDNISKLIHWLWKGPPLAKVIDVQCDEIPVQSFSSFEILRK